MAKRPSKADTWRADRVLNQMSWREMRLYRLLAQGSLERAPANEPEEAGRWYIVVQGELTEVSPAWVVRVRSNGMIQAVDEELRVSMLTEFGHQVLQRVRDEARLWL